MSLTCLVGTIVAPAAAGCCVGACDAPTGSGAPVGADAGTRAAPGASGFAGFGKTVGARVSPYVGETDGADDPGGDGGKDRDFGPCTTLVAGGTAPGEAVGSSAPLGPSGPPVGACVAPGTSGAAVGGDAGECRSAAQG